MYGARGTVQGYRNINLIFFGGGGVACKAQVLKGSGRQADATYNTVYCMQEPVDSSHHGIQLLRHSDRETEGRQMPFIPRGTCCTPARCAQIIIHLYICIGQNYSFHFEACCTVRIWQVRGDLYIIRARQRTLIHKFHSLITVFGNDTCSYISYVNKKILLSLLKDSIFTFDKV